MSLLKNHNTPDFEQILSLIEESRSKAFQKVNEQLILLYFRVGGIVSKKVAEGSWGDATINELAGFIQAKYPALRGFNWRGLYRMKQFYETYTDEKFVSTVLTQIKKSDQTTGSKILSPLVTKLEKAENQLVKIVSPLMTQLGDYQKKNSKEF